MAYYIGGAAAGAISTGTLKGAIIGAVSASSTTGIGHGFAVGWDAVFQAGARALAHGVHQGIVAEVSGGDFRDSFIGAAFSYLVSDIALDGWQPANDNFGQVLAKGAATAAIGGSAAVVGGGKFANGAYSASFVYAFNQMALPIPLPPAAGGGLDGLSPEQAMLCLVESRAFFRLCLMHY